MKKRLFTALICILIIAGLTAIIIFRATGPKGNTSFSPGSVAIAGNGSSAEIKNFSDGEDHINIYTLDRELALIIEKYAAMHPDFKYRIAGYENEEDFFRQMNYALQDGNKEFVDIYCVPASYAKWYIKGDYSRYACPYEDLGIDIEAALEKAGIPQKIIEAGTGPEGKLIALPYKADVNIFMYRRSIAQKIWGTDDPDEIGRILGAGTGKWDRFMDAAAKLKDRGFYVLPDFDQLSELVQTDVSVDLLSGKVGDIDTTWHEFMDLSKHLFDMGSILDLEPWTSEWIKALDRKSGKQVFGLFTQYRNIDTLASQLKKTAGDWAVCLPPVSVDTGFYPGSEDTGLYTGLLVNRDSEHKDAIGDLIEWMTLDYSETGLQYKLANGTFYDSTENDAHPEYSGKRTVISGTVLKNTENTIKQLHGQDVNKVLYEALQKPSGMHNAVGARLFADWVNESNAYLHGERDKQSAVTSFKEKAEAVIPDIRDIYKEIGFSSTEIGKLCYVIDMKNFNVWSYDSGLYDLFRQFAEAHPIYHYNINGFYQSYDSYYAIFSHIADNMQSEEKDRAGIYSVPAEYSYEMVKGDFSRHACTYSELGIDVDTVLEEIGLPQNIITDGKNPDGEIIALPYSADVYVFIYRRSIAREIWGTDDPDVIGDIIGAGTEKWDRFIEAARLLKEHGYHIIPGYKDANRLYIYGSSAGSPWEDNSMDPKWDEFMYISKQLYDNEYATDMVPWTEEWFNCLNGKSNVSAFGFFENYNVLDYMFNISLDPMSLTSTSGDWAICVPPVRSCYIPYTGIMVNKESPYKRTYKYFIEWLLDSSVSGGQHLISDGGKYAAISMKYLRSNECSIDYLGGQNTYPIIYDASQTMTYSLDGTGLPEIYELTDAYVKGEKDKETIIEEYKERKKIGGSNRVKYLEEAGLSFLIP